ncbi:MAG: ABC transporter ATP-binding protein [Clostridiales bacterium]|nr:ABC transporter ATP-binding protein [Clostridiales bacterium]
MNNYYFSTKKMCVGYDNNPLIKDIEIMLPKGEILCLIGPNGAGKSTVLKSIARQLELIGGTVYLSEDVLSEIKPEELAKRMSVVFTDRIRAELKSCRDVVATGRYPYTNWFGVLSKEDWKVVDEIMELTYIADIGDKDFDKISDGQKQRVMLARSLCQEPEIVILDEPTSYLDIRHKLEFLLLLQEMREKRNLTVIMSLHELELAKIVADKILCLKGEYVQRYGTPEEIFAADFIELLFDIEEKNFAGNEKILDYIRKLSGNSPNNS